MEVQQSSGQQPKFNYGEALQKSYLFYEANRAGDLPADGRIPWRGDSTLNDGKDVGRDLSGGYFDAGDHVKFGLPMAASMTMLAWGVDEFTSGYEKVGQLDEALDAIKWGTDYFLNAYDDKGTATTADDVFYGQVGNGQADHSYWGPPETMTMERPTYQVDAANPGSDITGETAAALASASIIFRSTDSAYADKLLAQAQKLYSFAETYKGKYSDSITDATTFYNSWSGYTDELAWGAAWLHKATKAAGQTDPQYLPKAEQYFKETNGIKYAPFTQNWDDKKYGTAILLAQETTDPDYKDQVETWLDNWTVDKANGGIPEYTDGGLAWISQWGSLRYSANTAMLASVYAETVNDKGGKYSEFAQSQINYMLGDNPNNRSYVVGFGENSPQNPHHRGAHGSTTNNINQGETKNILYGALVGGPSKPDDNAYADKRDDYIANEVTTDYNAGFTGALAYMADKFGGTPIADSEIPKLFDGSVAPPAPVDPSPVDPNPVDPNPVDPNPVDPNPVDPSPVDPNPVDPTPVDPTPVASGVDFAVTNSWEGGFQGSFSITNNSNSQINGWTLEFEYPNEITQIWNAEILSHTGNTYTIHDAGYDGAIAPDGTVSFGFTSNGSPSAVPSGFELNGQVLGAPVDPTPVDPTPVDPTPVDPTPVDPTPVDPTPIDPTPVDPANPSDAIRINVGGDAFTDSKGNVWSADQYFVGGNTYGTTAEIGQTTDDTLAQSERFQQNLSYEIPVENGEYTVNLGFAENYFDAAGKRIFDVSAEGALRLDNYDIYATAGGKNQQIQESLKVTVTDGVLNLDLSASANNAKLASIEVLKAASVDPTPIDPTPVDPTPVDPTPVDPTPVDPPNTTFVGGGETYTFGRGKTITGFDVTKDKIDLGPESIHNNIPIQTKDGLTFQFQWDKGTFTLAGIELKDLTAENFTAIKDDHLREDVSSVLTWAKGTAIVRPNTVYIRSHEQGVQEEVDFNPATDKISFMYYGNRGENSTVEETAAGVKFANKVTGQSMLLKGVKLSELNGSHFEFRMAQLKEDDIPTRMGLDQAITDFNVPDSNVFSREGIPTAGLVDRDPVYLSGYTQAYTGTATNPVPPPLTQGYEPPAGAIGPMPTDMHNHNHNAMDPMATSMTMMPQAATAADSLLAPAATLGVDSAEADAATADLLMGGGSMTSQDMMTTDILANNIFAPQQGMGEPTSTSNDPMTADAFGQSSMLSGLSGGHHLPLALESHMMI